MSFTPEVVAEMKFIKWEIDTHKGMYKGYEYYLIELTQIDTSDNSYEEVIGSNGEITADCKSYIENLIDKFWRSINRETKEKIREIMGEGYEADTLGECLFLSLHGYTAGFAEDTNLSDVADELEYQSIEQYVENTYCLVDGEIHQW